MPLPWLGPLEPVRLGNHGEALRRSEHCSALIRSPGRGAGSTGGFAQGQFAQGDTSFTITLTQVMATGSLANLTIGHNQTLFSDLGNGEMDFMQNDAQTQYAGAPISASGALAALGLAGLAGGRRRRA